MKQLIAQGENLALEFKREDVTADSVAKEMVAFANAGGGILLIGIEDDGQLSGILNSKIDEAWAVNIARNNIIPALNIMASFVKVDEKNILFIEVPKGKDKPYQTNKFQFLIRVGSTNRVATQTELLRLFQHSGALHYDKLGVESTSESMLNYSKVSHYFNIFNIQFDTETPEQREKLLRNADILTEDGKLTVAGTLCFSLNPSKYLYQTGVIFAHFNGEAITDELIDRQEIIGTLDYVIDTSLAVVKNNLKVPSKIVGAKREEQPPAFSDKTLREVITNACVHRDYSIAGSQIRILLFNNRLEVHSPGRLPNTITIDKVKVGASYPRNPVIASFLTNLRYIDKLGRGIPMVLQEGLQKGKKVWLEEFGEEFIVTLYL
ncbi:MAG: putative DNA binding domain-containing protein [Saprospiraceae bacterium]|nr:putative DNA binding domain-containing protein [Saprospiraceae bacterium]